MKAKMNKLLKKLFGRLLKIRALRHVKPIIVTLEGIALGTKEITPGAPHFVDNIEIKRYMLTAIIALLPAAVASIIFYGFHAVLMFAASYVAGGIVEVAFALIRKKEIEEGFLVTGLIFPLILPPTTPIWVVVVGVAFGVMFGKEVFGGTGRNIFNPALVGRIFITIAFPEIMSASWQLPFTDVITSATPLALFKSSQELTGSFDLLFGRAAGSMGEIFRIGIILGGLFLMATRVSNWRIPLSYLGSVLLFSWLGNLFIPESIAPPVFQLLTGGLLFGAMFMSTDPVTSPITRLGKYIVGIASGLLTVVIRSFSGFTEGVMFSIIFMNALTPLIDHIIVSNRYKVTQ